MSFRFSLSGFVRSLSQVVMVKSRSFVAVPMTRFCRRASSAYRQFAAFASRSCSRYFSIVVAA